MDEIVVDVFLSLNPGCQGWVEGGWDSPGVGVKTAFSLSLPPNNDRLKKDALTYAYTYM